MTINSPALSYCQQLVANLVHILLLLQIQVYWYVPFRRKIFPSKTKITQPFLSFYLVRSLLLQSQWFLLPFFHFLILTSPLSPISKGNTCRLKFFPFLGKGRQLYLLVHISKKCIFLKSFAPKVQPTSACAEYILRIDMDFPL